MGLSESHYVRGRVANVIDAKEMGMASEIKLRPDPLFGLKPSFALPASSQGGRN